MKKFTMGLIVGVCLMVSATVFAASGIEKVTAYINNDVKIEIDGKEFTSEFPILVYEGRTYLPLRTVGEDMLGSIVDWDGDRQTILINSVINEEDVWSMGDVTQTVEETTYEGLKAVVYDGETYFNLRDYSLKFAPISWGYDSETENLFLARHSDNGAEVLETFVTVNKDEPGALLIHKGESYINTRYYQEVPIE